MRFIAIFGVLSSLAWSSSSEAAKYKFGTSGSTVTFHNTASLHGIDGVAKVFKGSFDSDAGTGVLTVQTRSMTTNLGPRDKKMHNYCLEVDKYPTIEFSVAKVQGGDALNSGAYRGRVNLDGELTIRDVTRAISVPTTFETVGKDLFLKGEIAFKWTDFDVPDPSIFISTLYPDMSVKFSLKLIGEEPLPPSEVAPDPNATEAAPEPSE